MYVLSGEHSFRFESSKITLNGTTFVNSKKHFRLLYWLAPLLVGNMTMNFEEFNRDLKARVEILKKSSRVAHKGEAEA